jgi:hypothetical protein
MGDGTRIGAGAKNENPSSRVKCPQMHHNHTMSSPKIMRSGGELQKGQRVESGSEMMSCSVG